MAESYNVYVDESCHLQNDGHKVMVLGAIWCPQEKTREIAMRIRDIKEQNGVSTKLEVKWNKVSQGKLPFYQALIDYFLDDDDLRFRAIVVPDKSRFVGVLGCQSHDGWYYKLCFQLLEQIVDPTQHYNIYMDIKDTRSELKRRGLEAVLREANYDGDGDIVRKIQQVRSHESALLQMTDLWIGAIAYANRSLSGNNGKLAIIKRIRKRTQLSLTRSTWVQAPKVNIQIWNAEGDQ